MVQQKNKRQFVVFCLKSLFSNNYVYEILPCMLHYVVYWLSFFMLVLCFQLLFFYLFRISQIIVVFFFGKHEFIKFCFIFWYYFEFQIFSIPFFYPKNPIPVILSSFLFLFL